MSGSLASLAQELESLQADYALKMAAVVGLDGLLIAESSTDEIDAEMVSAVAAPGLIMMADLAGELNENLPQVTTLEYERHVVIMHPLNNDTLLIVVSEPGAMNLGQLRIVVRRATERLRAYLENV